MTHYMSTCGPALCAVFLGTLDGCMPPACLERDPSTAAGASCSNVAPATASLLDFVILDDGTALLFTSDGEFIRGNISELNWAVVRREVVTDETEVGLASFVRGAGDSIWTIRYVYTSDGYEAAFLVSYDGGVTFVDLELRDDHPIPEGSQFLELPGENPLLLDVPNGVELWRSTESEPRSMGAFERIAQASPIDGVIPIFYCNETMYGYAFDLAERRWSVLSTVDLGSTWKAETEQFSQIVRSACARQGGLWLLFDSAVVHYRATDRTWNAVAFQEGVGDPTVYDVSLAAEGDYVYVAGRTLDDQVFIRRYCDPADCDENDLQIELPLPPADDRTRYVAYQLRVDDAGTLYAASKSLFRYDRNLATWIQLWP